MTFDIADLDLPVFIQALYASCASKGFEKAEDAYKGVEGLNRNKVGILLNENQNKVIPERESQDITSTM